MTIRDFVGSISSNLHHNLTKLSRGLNVEVSNTSTGILQQLELQSKSKYPRLLHS